MAARSPAPGGGSSSAWTCALAAALVEMAAAFAPDAVSAGPGDDGPAAERARRLRRSALELAERELESYAPVLEALRCAPGAQRERRLRAALSRAAEAPLEIARCAAETADLGVLVLAGGSRHLRGDAVTGVLLAEAACTAAVQLVGLNLAGDPDDPRHAEAGRLAGTAAAARRRALG